MRDEPTIPARRPGAELPPDERPPLCDVLACAQLDALQGKQRRERIELVTTGFDDFLGLLGGPPGGAVPQTPTSIGLKIPTLPSSANGCPYVALCNKIDLDHGERFVGFAQYLTIAAMLSGSEGGPPPIPPVQMREREVVSVGWHPEDVPPVTWYVTVESKQPANVISDPLESASFAYCDSDTPAIVYRTAHIPSPPLIPGYLALDAYTAPQILGSPLYRTEGMSYPMRRNDFCAVRYVASTTVTIRVYALVWQTDPAARIDTISGLSSAQVEFASTSLDPEDSFAQVFPNAWQFRAVGCRLVVDKLTARRW